MEKLIRLYGIAESKVANYQEMIAVTENLPYYDVFDMEEEKRVDLQLLRSSLKEVLSEKYMILEKIKREAEMEMRKVSQVERDVTMLKNAAA